MSHDTSRDDWVHHLARLSRGFMASRVFLTAVELNVFGLLGGRRLTSLEMASLMDANARATETLLNALASMGLLDKTGDRYANIAVEGESLLLDGLVRSGGSGYGVRLWEAASHLTEIVRSGRPFTAFGSGDVRREFALSTRHYALGAAEALTRVVDFADVACMLDLGGGTGAHAIAIAQRSPQMRAVVLDKDEQALGLAREEIVRERLEDRIRLQCSDFSMDDLGRGYDLVLLSSVICLFTEEENQALLRRARDSLAPGGRIVILDSMVDSSHTRPAAAALFSVTMLLTTHGGRSYPYGQVAGWLARLGFQHIRRTPLHGAHVIEARRGPGEDPGR